MMKRRFLNQGLLVLAAGLSLLTVLPAQAADEAPDALKLPRHTRYAA